jgi:CelD/BcsL family acetyltransferase involved in cellulose biosynthesis
MSLPSPPAHSATVLRRYADFLALEPEWRELFAAAERPMPYLRHRWLRLSWEMLWRRPFNRLRVVLIRDRTGALVMAGAFVIRFYRLVPTVEFLHAGVPQYGELLWRPSPETAAQAALLLDTLLRSTRFAPVLRALQLRDDSPLKAAILARGLRSRVRRSQAAAFVPLRHYRDFEHYLSTLPGKLRPDHRRQLRHLAELPGFGYQHETGAAAAAAIRWSLDTKRKWLAERGYVAGWLSGGLVDRFLARFLAGSDDVPECWVGTLRVGGSIIATSISFIERDTVYFSKIAHDPAFGRYSPGRTLTLNEIGHAFARHMAEFDMGRGTIAWKRRLTPAERLVTSERIRLR